ncbi:glutathione S-transferase family protein [Sphingosinicella sp. CPCC 101087]|uniref:glutathione S-transferase family protein n=1 Tax=Sphingosinicella sp. CPCC 101087 TaxID=2497754 RepID=UPI00101BA499|nr:glutathione S-transferase family protein [Sphingosinicella sp. CPCC 101087]
MKLHAHPLSSYCWKALIALYENETPFTFHELNPMDPEAHAAFAALWPLAKMPVLEDGGRVVAETSIIIEHLGLHHPGPVRLIPEDPDAALEVRLLDRIFDNYMMTPMQRIVFERFRADGHRDPGAVESAHALIATARGLLEERLDGRTWAAGEDFSLADCAAAPSLHYAEKVQPSDGRFPTLAAYLERLESRPSFARVLKEAEPYAHMFPAED